VSGDDIVERLRAEVAQLRGSHSEMLQYAAGRDAVITRLTAEVERLRADLAHALNEIRYLCDGDDGD